MVTTKQTILAQAERDYHPEIASVDDEAVGVIAAQSASMAGAGSQLDYWFPLDQQWDLQQAALYWTVFAAQAFRFWRINADGDKEKLHYAGVTGSNAMLAIIRDCWNTDAASAINFDAARFQEAVAGLPAMSPRVVVANELSADWARLRAIVGGFILKAQSQALSVSDAAELAVAFPRAFEDPYFKKAQLAVSAISGLVKSKHPEAPHPVGLTAMADYQVPRVLRALKVLQYSADLADKVSRHQLIDAGSEEENAIRAATVLAVEQISQRANLSSEVIDNLLWSSQEVAGDECFHLTETTCY
ncbi:hypothetical protein EZI54_07035 [Marinobacter halodurans]|uniref:Queuosine 5'-phosphate N-glycosylase/hydrolase n=1 Tax=Marinobacter halodurans TaxID=2528979 RepID=A0ABY1ZP91_9GAMM|nr:queuosine salvage family protein [Marinobacter halodurans]TBW57405.1 hypothetical protein EZI54_07035 [Marinobacter halodurans]